MKRLAFGILVLEIVLAPLFSSSAFAKEDKSAAKEAAKFAERVAKEKERHKELNNAQWSVTVTPRDPKKKTEKFPDEIVFQNNTVGFRSFMKRGYAASQFTLVLPETEGGEASWEAGQVGQEATLYIRGDWTGDRMYGVLTEVASDGKTSTSYGFLSSKKAALEPAAKEGSASKALGTAEGNSPSTTALVSKESEIPPAEQKK